MKKNFKRNAMILTAINLILALPSSFAHAALSEEAEKLLIERLKQLEEKVKKLEKSGNVAKQNNVKAKSPTSNSANAGNANQSSANGAASGLMQTSAEDPSLPQGFRGLDHFDFKGIKIIPGGFIAAETVWRSRWMGADNNTPYQNIPYSFYSPSHTNEFHMSARQSRVSTAVEGDINAKTHVAGYLELDFFGAAQTANSNESNSYNPRLRQMYVNLDSDEYGVHFTGGQMWSLATMNMEGIKANNSLQPPTIDAQYMPGYVWARQPGLRLTKDFNKEFWVAVSVENGAMTVGSVPTVWNQGALGFISPKLIVGPSTGAYSQITGPLMLAAATSGGLYDANNNYSLTRLPDFIGKAAWDPKIGEDRKVHLEAFGMLRDFTDRMWYGNHSVWGGGFGAGAIIPILPKVLDFQISGMTGRGIGRYGAGQISDAFFTLSGAPQPISERLLMMGLTLHPFRQTDIYAFAGGEFASNQPQYFTVGKTTFAGGYGNPFYNNVGCNIENPITSNLDVGQASALGGVFSCSGQTQKLRQVTGGFWHTLYHGAFGKVRVGAQYSYSARNGFNGVGGSPTGNEHMWYTSFRYYPYDGVSDSLGMNLN